MNEHSRLKAPWRLLCKSDGTTWAIDHPGAPPRYAGRSQEPFCLPPAVKGWMESTSPEEP